MLEHDKNKLSKLKKIKNYPIAFLAKIYFQMYYAEKEWDEILSKNPNTSEVGKQIGLIGEKIQKVPSEEETKQLIEIIKKNDKEFRELKSLCKNKNFDYDYAKHLISMIDVNEYCLEGGHTLLFEAYLNDNLSMIKLLVESGADLNQSCDSYYVGCDECSPLIYELMYSNEEYNEEEIELEQAYNLFDEDNNIQIQILRYILLNGAKVDFKLDFEYLIEYVLDGLYENRNEVFVYQCAYLKNIFALSTDLADYMEEVSSVHITKLSLYDFHFSENGKLIGLFDEKGQLLRIFNYHKYLDDRYK